MASNLFRRFPSDDLVFEESVDNETMLFVRDGRFENQFWEAPQVVSVGMVEEAESVGAMTAAKRVTISQVSEVESVGAVTAAKRMTLQGAAESDAGLAWLAAKGAVISQVSEVESAFAMTVQAVKLKVLGQVSEESVALGMLAVRVARPRTVLARDFSLVVKPRETAFDVPGRDISFDVR